MKKNRNAFFQESNSNFQSFNPMAGNMPYQVNANSSYYAGNIPNNINNMPINYQYNDIEERLAKIERQINRLDRRISLIENNNIKSTDDFDINTNNMYMI